MGADTGKQVDMRGRISVFAFCIYGLKENLIAVVDIFRRDGDKLAENWVFIDLLHFWKQQGLDILQRMEKDNTYRSPC